MREISIKELNEIRGLGYRPGVVCCLTHKGQLLLMYKKEYSLWLIPQGGIHNQETYQDALGREIKSELGITMFSNCLTDFTYIGEGDLVFNKKSQGLRELRTDDGKEIEMLGKKYFFFNVPVATPVLDISESEFDEYAWVNYDQAKFLLSLSYQIQKRELTLNALEKLKEYNFVD